MMVIRIDDGEDELDANFEVLKVNEQNRYGLAKLRLICSNIGTTKDYSYLIGTELEFKFDDVHAISI